MTGFAILIGVYIPAGFLLGATVAWLVKSIPIQKLVSSKIRLPFSLAAALLLFGIGLWFTEQRLHDIHPEKYALATRPDILASKWIEENTPSDARLLVNSFPALTNSVIVGSDAGWWLPLLAHRPITVPPINYGFEKDPLPGYAIQTNALTFEIGSVGIQAPKVLADLTDRNVSYIYVGQLQGKVNSSGPLFTSAQLRADPAFHLIYHQDRVWIFQIQQVRR